MTIDDIKALPCTCERDREIKEIALKMFNATYPQELKKSAEFRVIITYESAIMNLRGSIPAQRLVRTTYSHSKYY